MTRVSGPDSRVRKSIKPFESIELPHINKGKRNSHIEKIKVIKLKSQKVKSISKGISKRVSLYIISSSDEFDDINPLLSI
jgi:hypothetical protein